MQLQAAGAGLSPQHGGLIAGLPPGLFQQGPPGGQAIPGGIPGLPPSLLQGLSAGIPPTSVAALAAAAAHYGQQIRPPLGSIEHHMRKEAETPNHKSGTSTLSLYLLYTTSNVILINIIIDIHYQSKYGILH